MIETRRLKNVVIFIQTILSFALSRIAKESLEEIINDLARKNLIINKKSNGRDSLRRNTAIVNSTITDTQHHRHHCQHQQQYPQSQAQQHVQRSQESNIAAQKIQSLPF